MKATKYIRTLMAFIFSTAVLAANAQIDTIRLKDRRLNLKAFKMGERKFFHYMEFPGKNTTVKMTLVKINIQPVSVNGEAFIAENETWQSTDTAEYINYRSLNRASDFAPVYQYDFSENTIKAYNWSDQKITGADTVAGNIIKNFSLGLKGPAFNGNQDFQVFEMLPLAAGKQFAINFYVAGLKPPEYAIYKVSGSEAINTPAGPVDCWKLTTAGSYNNGKSHYTQCFWLSKKTHELLKEESEFDGTKLHKVRVWD